jgi:molecular chaperone DnaK
VPQIEVTFDIDANGIVNVSAKDKGTGKEQQIRIQASGGLSEDDIDRMVKDAEEHAADDQKRRETVEARNQAETLVHQTEKGLEEHGEKVSDEDKASIEGDMAALNEALEGEDGELIQTKLEALVTSSMKLGEAIYKAAQAESEEGMADGGADGGPEGDAADGLGETIVDADFQEVDDDDDADTDTDNDDDDRKDQSSAS